MLGSAAGGGSVLGGVGVSLGGVAMETDGGAGSRAFPGTGLRAPSLSIPRTHWMLYRPRMEYGRIRQKCQQKL